MRLTANPRAHSPSGETDSYGRLLAVGLGQLRRKSELVAGLRRVERLLTICCVTGDSRAVTASALPAVTVADISSADPIPSSPARLRDSFLDPRSRPRQSWRVRTRVSRQPSRGCKRRFTVLLIVCVREATSPDVHDRGLADEREERNAR